MTKFDLVEKIQLANRISKKESGAKGEKVIPYMIFFYGEFKTIADSTF